MHKYSIGLDYGTLSARCVLTDVSDGSEKASTEFVYPHGVMDTAMSDGSPLPHDWALQHPRDYIEALPRLIPAALEAGNVSPDEIVGIGVDFTACTPLPVTADGTPLCFTDRFARSPHAYAKLWKHHAAKEQAEKLSRIAAGRGERWLERCGGTVSSEWMIPKIWQTLDEAPEVYETADMFIEAGDWIVMRLTGVCTRNACAAGYKAMWSKDEGYPSEEFFKALDPRLERVASDKLRGEVLPAGTVVGGLTSDAALLTGLREGTPVGAANIDGHACVPAAGISGEGELLDIIGTSSCHMLLGVEARPFPGLCGVVEDGMLPGFFGYEAGQAAVGDIFGWFTHSCVPEKYAAEAKKAGKGLHEYLTEKAEKLSPGGSGLLALDWWNGNRSLLCAPSLSGLILGMTLTTKPEELYRALIESTAFGTRMITEAFRDAGFAVNALLAAGGIAAKNAMLCQIYADVLGMPVYPAGGPHGSALGSAILGAVAGGAYPDIPAAARAMGRREDRAYLPSPASKEVYDKLFAEYKRLHDYFGRGGNNVMKTLRELKTASRA